MITFIAAPFFAYFEEIEEIVIKHFNPYESFTA